MKRSMQNVLCLIIRRVQDKQNHTQTQMNRNIDDDKRTNKQMDDVRR